MIQDLLEKRAGYISRNSEFNQEFSYAHPARKSGWTTCTIQVLYGAPLWSLFDRDFEKLEKSWNVSLRIMLHLPKETHRFFIEPLSKTRHIVKSIKSRFTSFLSKIWTNHKERTTKDWVWLLWEFQTCTMRVLNDLFIIVNQFILRLKYIIIARRNFKTPRCVRKTHFSICISNICTSQMTRRASKWCLS